MTDIHPTQSAPAVQARPPRDWSWLAGGPAIVLYIAAARLLLHLLTATRYGYFGDELYHLACGEHLDWGYVDQPPLIGLIAWVTRHTIGDSLFAIHLVAALCGAALVWQAGAIARQLGARRFAQALTAVGVATAGIYLIMHRLFTMNMVEPLIWMGCAWLVIRIVKTGNQRMWLWFGVLAGIGLQNKYSMGVFAFGVVLGLLLTRERKAFARVWIWLGGAIALAIFLPNLLWNINHHWPFLELMRNIRASGRDIALGPLEYIVHQVFLISPASFPIWLAGVLYFFFSPEGKRFRVLGWTFAAVLTVFIALHGKDYYTAPVFPMLLAAGSVAIQNAFEHSKMSWLKPVMMATLLVVTAALLPIAVPVLSAEDYLQYQARLPFALPVSERSHASAALPHHYAWCFGWEEMVAAVSRIYHSLPPEERVKTAIFGNNFAEAGAIDLLGSKYGLPKAIGGHQSYFLWGPRDYTGEIVIVLGSDRQGELEHFRQVEVAAELHHPYARPGENRPVLLCRGLKWDLKEVWPRVKNWD